MLVTLALLTLTNDWNSFGLSDPVRLRTDGAYIDVEHGHASPLFTDFDGDGKLDLLVGQFEGGTLRVYLNSGSNTAPKFGKFSWFQAGGTTGKVPFG